MIAVSLFLFTVGTVQTGNVFGANPLAVAHLVEFVLAVDARDVIAAQSSDVVAIKHCVHLFEFLGVAHKLLGQ